MRIRTLLFACTTLLLTGCSSSLEVVVSGEPGMNNGGNAAVVKIYQLTGEGNFASTPLSVFWRDDTGALGKELVEPPRTLTIYPSVAKPVEIDLAAKTKYIGVAANLRNPDREEWRSVHAVKGMGDQISVTVGSDRLAVIVEDRTLPTLGVGPGR